MNKLQNTAKKLDTLFRVLDICLKICLVALLVGLAIIAAAFLFSLDPDTVGTGYTTVVIGCLDLTLAEGFAPDKSAVLVQVAAEMALALICVILAHFFVKCVRDIFKPMIQGEPFQANVSDNLKKLAVFILALGFVVNIIEVITAAAAVWNFDLANILLSDKITHVTFTFPFDLDFLITSAVLLLASYVFQYGEQLQQLSDETL